MYLKELILRNFRNYRDLEIEFPPGLLIFNGSNAQGKSNLLESIYILALTKSPKATSDKELIRFDSLETDPFTRIAGTINRSDDVASSVQIDIGLLESAVPGNQRELNSSLHKQIRINGIPRRPSETIGTINAVLFSSDDLALISGSPSIRRKFLTILISQFDRGYLKMLQKYQKIVSERNHLLKKIGSGYGNLSELTFWDQEFCTLASNITQVRLEAVSELFRLTLECYSTISSTGEAIRLDYLPAIREEESGAPCGLITEETIKEVRNRELLLGQTIIGPHRDDLSIKLNGSELAKFGSRGQFRTMAIALRLAEGKLLTKNLSEEPILLLDDALSEMDSMRQRKILDSIGNTDQVLLTTVDSGQNSIFPIAQSTNYQVTAGNILVNSD